MEKIFIDAKSILEEMLILLRKGRDLLPQKRVPIELLKQGFTNYKGVITPTKTVSHRYLFDDFETPFLEAYIALFRKLLEEHVNISNEFAFRTLLEMGCEDSFIIFDKIVENDDKKLFILILLLADYSSIETNERALFNGWLIKLFQENIVFLKSRISKSDFNSLIEFKNLLHEQTIPLVRYTILLKIARQLVSKVKSVILNKYAQKKIFGLSDTYKRMKSGESHMLHGNAFLILDRMSNQPVENHEFRVFAYLTIAGTDILNRLSGFLNDGRFTEKTDCFMKKLNDFKPKFNSEWETVRRHG